MKDKILGKLKEFFSLDYRSLALMRFSMGVLILTDLIQRVHSLTAHYSDSGVFTRADLVTLYSNRFYISLHMISGLASVEGVLFIIAAIFAIMLMFGYRTRLATIISWFLLISLQSRNPMVVQGGDIVFRVVLFWMIFLPTGARWSLDRLFNREPRQDKKNFIGAAAIAYITQIVLVYVMSGVLKTGAPWNDGTAVYYALSIDQLVRPLGEWLLHYGGLTALLTYATIKIEVFGSILFFSPIKTGLLRTIGIILFALLQIGFNISMHLGLFGAIMIVVTLGLLPSYFWDVWWVKIAGFFTRRAKTGLAFYYDGNCGFCYKMAHILRRFLLLSKTTIIDAAPIDSEIARQMEQKNSWVVIGKNGEMLFGFKGLAEVMRYSPIFFWLAPILRLRIFSPLGEWCYKKIADSRLQVCLPEPVIKKPSDFVCHLRALGSVTLIFLTIFVVIWNADPNDKSGLLAKNRWIAWTTRLDQQFGMFAPMPLTEDGWYVIDAKLEDGREVDIFKDGPMFTGKKLYPVSYEKPKNVAGLYPDQRWQKYLMNISERDNSEFRLGYGKYICRTWNTTHTGGEVLDTFNIIYMIETTPAPGENPTPPKKALLWNHHCFETPPITPPTPPSPKDLEPKTLPPITITERK